MSIIIVNFSNLSNLISQILSSSFSQESATLTATSHFARPVGLYIGGLSQGPCFPYSCVCVPARQHQRMPLRPIFVTKTKIKTKMIHFHAIKTKTKTISFQKRKRNKNKNDFIKDE